MVNMQTNIIFIVFLLFGTVLSMVRTEPTEDKKILLDFINKTPHNHVFDWSMDLSACTNWTGVTCDHNQLSIIAVRLPAVGFDGTLPLDMLGRLSNLQILSLRSNNLSGPFPSDLYNLRHLTRLYLECNSFSGPLPVNFSVWNNLAYLNLSNNGFSGSIPPSISSLTHLTALSLANNSLSGEIPEFSSASLQVLDLSYNNFTGTVPQSLIRFPSSAFSGNNLETEPEPLPAVSPKRSKKSKLKHELGLIGIVIGVCVLVLVLLLLLISLRHRKKERNNKALQMSGVKEKKKMGMESRSRSLNGNGNLVFFEGSNLAFDLEDLFRASAEVLGKGTFGTTYKAALEESSVVVKRLQGVSVARREFEQQMEIVGRIRHDNVVPLRAYYYSKDEKLMVHDYYGQGSVSSMLHATRGSHRIPLDWNSRLRIAIGAARGIAHIHTQASGKAVHGNIKASNTFVNNQGFGCVSDLCLVTLMSPTLAPVMRSGGYQAPELTDIRKVYQASDVYSYGVLLLELLTGKSPSNATSGNEAIHLVRWVQSVVQEEWTAEVFDVELLRYPNIEEEMVEMLQIGMQCVAKSPEQRPKMEEVLNLVQNIRTGEQTMPWLTRD